MKSEVARIRESIEAELASMRLGLNGLAAGTSKHAFIEAKMHRVGGYEEQLAQVDVHLAIEMYQEDFCGIGPLFTFSAQKPVEGKKIS